MAVALTGTDATQVTLSSTGSWERRDLDSDYALPEGTTGVILVFAQTTSDGDIGARKYNNTNYTQTEYLDDRSRCTCYVEVDSNHEVEIYREHSGTDVYIVGYFTTDATWLSSPVDVTPGSTGWQDMDLSSYTSGGEVFAMFEVTTSTSNRGVAFRYNGAADDRSHSYSVNHHWAIMGLDGSDIIEAYCENITDVTIWLIGFVTSGTVRTTGGSDLFAALGTGSYEDITLPDSGKEIAILEASAASTNIAFNVRPNGDTSYPDIYDDISHLGNWGITAIDGSDLAEAKIETTDAECYCWGYLEAAAAGDLSIDTIQSVNISESIVGQLSVAGVNVSENINLTESVILSDLLLNIEINIAQQIKLSESVSGFLNLAGITIDDSINISESIAGFLNLAGVSVTEDIEVSENISAAMNLGAINVNEALELAEALTSGVPLGFNQFENITLTEFLTLLETIAPSAFDNITVAEYLALLKDIGLSEFENITLTESITAALQQAGLNVFDSISIEEFISVLKDIGVDTSQDITITEVVNAVMALAGIEAAEDVTINEALSLLMSLAGIETAQSISISEFVSGLLEVAGVDVSDNLALTEFVNLLTTSDLPITDAAESVTISEVMEILFSHLPLTAEQNISIIESVTAALETTGIDMSDSVNISEYALLILSLGLIDVSDSVTISEAVTALLETTGANVYDTISVNEFIRNILEVAGINVNESVTVSEWIYVTMVTVAGLMRVNFSVRKPYLNYATRKPKITFN